LPELLNIKYVYVPSLFVAAAVELYAKGATIVIGLDDELTAPDTPEELAVVTVNVYEVPFVSPETVTGDDEPVPVNPPGLEVTVYVGLPLPL
jgi:hypothetical protein